MANTENYNVHYNNLSERRFMTLLSEKKVTVQKIKDDPIYVKLKTCIYLHIFN